MRISFSCGGWEWKWRNENEIYIYFCISLIFYIFQITLIQITINFIILNVINNSNNNYYYYVNPVQIKQKKGLISSHQLYKTVDSTCYNFIKDFDTCIYKIQRSCLRIIMNVPWQMQLQGIWRLWNHAQTSMVSWLP